MKLYAWQQECLKAWENNHCRGIAHVITGAGKTVMALEAIRSFRARYRHASIRVVVPTIPLAHQWESALLRVAESEEDNPGFFGAGKRDTWNQSIMIYIINSAREALSSHMEQLFAVNRPVLLICDECHHYQSQENRKIFDFRLPPFYPPEQYACLGLSATPFGTANDDVLVQSLGKEIYSYGFENATADGIVSSFTVLETAASFLPEERAKYMQLSHELVILWNKLLRKYPHLKQMQDHAFQIELARLAQAANQNPSDPAVAFRLKTWERKEVSNLALTRIQCALAILRALPGDARVILFCERIIQAKDMLSLLRRKLGNIGVIYHSEMTREARDRSLDDFRTSRARLLICCKALDEGIDVPDANVGIVLSSTSVSRQRIQRLGRILRRAPGKMAASLYYIYIPESSDDQIYLPEFLESDRVSLHYNTLQNAFSNELYEYTALEILKQSQNMTPAQQKELRLCLEEGLPRADYLLSPETLRSMKDATTHESNYWKTMLRVSRLYHLNEPMETECPPGSASHPSQSASPVSAISSP